MKRRMLGLVGSLLLVGGGLVATAGSAHAASPCPVLLFTTTACVRLDLDVVLGLGVGVGVGADLGQRHIGVRNGDIVVPYLSLSDTIRSFRSTNGGTSWSSSVQIAAASHHTVAGSLREEILPSAEADAAGTVYVAWSDCRFRSGCARNDIVIAKSTSETTWATPIRVPIDATSSTVDHFIPGIGAPSPRTPTSTTTPATLSTPTTSPTTPDRPSPSNSPAPRTTPTKPPSSSTTPR